MGTKSSYLQSLGTLQLLAVITVVIGHFWVKNNAFLNSLCVSFCFVYSGFFTAMHHRFGPEYGFKSHVRFMWNKLARLYPLHVLAIVLCIITTMATGESTGPSFKVLLAHFTLLSPWIPVAGFYFGVNPVAWFVCDLFFLYLMAPLVVRFLRKIPVLWQVVLIVALLVAEYFLGYSIDIKEHLGDGIIGAYYYYEFPPCRLLDFGAGIILYNLTQTAWWEKLKNTLTATTATIIEVAGIALFLVLYHLGESRIHAHCYRAFCASAPAVMSLLTAFMLTSNRHGIISSVLSIRPLAKLSTVNSEIYLLQFCGYFALLPLCKHLGIYGNTAVHLPVVIIVLCLMSWLIHYYYCEPIKRRLSIR